MTFRFIFFSMWLLALVPGCEKTANPPALAADKKLFFIGDSAHTIGFIDVNGAIIIPKKFDFGGGDGSFKEGMLRIISNGKIGYIDTTGRIAIAPIYRAGSAGDFSDGLAFVAIEEKSGYIDKTGKTVIDFIYHKAGDFSEGLAFVETDDGTLRIIDKTGKVAAVVERREPCAPETAFLNGFALMKDAYGRFAYIGADGRFITNFRFGAANSFQKEGFAVAYDVGLERSVLIDKTGKTAFPHLGEYWAGGWFSDGLIPIGIGPIDARQWGFMNAAGAYVIQPRYSGVTVFGDGLAAVQEEKSRLWGFIDVKGRMVVKPQFAKTRWFSDGMALVSYRPERTGGEKDWGYINAKGEMIIKPHDGIASRGMERYFFHDGLARFSDKTANMRGYINKAGEVVYREAGTW
ncbi:MAG: WG repeat-containing protein [Spirochaetales bacterium]|nr:WG repeat-containing protein [Spirochaetales bacterium]